MKTNRGLDVEVVLGDAVVIADRGKQISELAEKMSSAAITLEGIKNETIAGKGYAMDKIKEVVGDSHTDLAEAGRRYGPAGSTLSAYATALATAQQNMKVIVQDCNESLQALQTAENATSNATASVTRHDSGSNLPLDDEATARWNATGDKLEASLSSAVAAEKLARAEHDVNLGLFDVAYDTWAEAYNLAVTGLTNANKIGEDSRWENIAGVIAVVVEVLKWVGLAVAILGLIIGGPFFAIAAIVVGVLVLVGTIALMFDGRANGWDVAWAVVGILPVGKLGAVFKAGKGARLGQFRTEFVNQFKNPVQQMRTMKKFKDLVKPPYGSQAFRSYYGQVRGLRKFGQNPIAGTRLMNLEAGMKERLLFGPSRSYQVAFHETVTSGSPYFQKNLQEVLPKSLQNLSEAPKFSTWEAAWNTYRWTDRGVSLTTEGRPAGTASPVRIFN